MKGAFLRYRLPAILWSALLLSFSTSFASARNTGRGLAGLLFWLIGHDPSFMALEVTNVFLRKLTHLSAYAIEGALMLRAARNGRVGAEGRWIAQALAWTLFVASLDEFNQAFTPGRSGSVADVVLDFIGAAIAVLLLRRRNPALK